MSLCNDCKHQGSCGISQTLMRSSVNDCDAFSMKKKESTIRRMMKNGNIRKQNS